MTTLRKRRLPEVHLRGLSGGDGGSVLCPDALDEPPGFRPAQRRTSRPSVVWWIPPDETLGGERGPPHASGMSHGELTLLRTNSAAFCIMWQRDFIQDAIELSPH